MAVKKTAKKTTTKTKTETVAKSKIVSKTNPTFLKKVTSFKKFCCKTKGGKNATTLVVLLILGAILYYSRSLFFAGFVNGSPITRIELVQEMEKVAGQQTLDSIVMKKIILQEANKKGVKVTDEVIQAEIDTISEMMVGQGTTLEAALALQGQTVKALEENIRMQKTVEELLADSVAVTDEEAQAYFDENEVLYEDVEFETVKEEIRDQLKIGKLSSEYQAWMDSLKAEANIVNFVSF